jgi:hypothetical protein
LDASARLDIRDDLLKSTPLGWACRWGGAELVRLVLEHGADPVEADAEPWRCRSRGRRRCGATRCSKCCGSMGGEVQECVNEEL